MEKIKLEEKYGKLNLTDAKIEVTDNIILKCSNGITIETDMINNDAVITNKEGKELSLKSLIPIGYSIKISKLPWHADPESKTIFMPMISDEEKLLVWIHEIGHSWDFFNNEKEYIEKGFYADKLKRNNKMTKFYARIERTAWAWAFKKIRSLRKDGFISNKLSNEVLRNFCYSALFSYAKSYGWFKNNKLFLNKEVEYE